MVIIEKLLDINFNVSTRIETPFIPEEKPDATHPKPGGNEPEETDPTRVKDPVKTDPTKIDEQPPLSYIKFY